MIPETDIASFIDLATAPMGEDDLAVDKARSVLNALNGFSPLIYELKDNSDYPTFIKCCEKVWDTLKQNETKEGKNKMIADLVKIRYLLESR